MAFGLRPAKTAGGGYYSGGLIEVPVIDPATYTTSIFNGDPVILNAGSAERGATAPVDTDLDVVGFMVGARYVDPEGTPKWNQYYPGNASNTDVWIIVATAEQGAVWEVEGNAAWAEAQRGTQCPLVTGAGSTVTGNSGYVVDNDTPDVAGAAIIVDVKRDGENESSSTPIVYVRLATGVAVSDTGN